MIAICATVAYDVLDEQTKRRHKMTRPTKFTDLGRSLDDLVSDANPVSWREWLPKRCDKYAKQNGVQMYSSSNCHYIVCEDRVFARFGYHGRNLLNDLATNGTQWYYERYIEMYDEINELYGKVARE
jgi:hypothetical protein